MENGWKDDKECFDVNRNRLKIIHTFWQSGHFRWNKGCGKIPDHHSSSWLSPPEGIKSSLIYVCVMNKKYWLGAMSISLFLNIESISQSLRWKLATPIRKEINGLTGKSISLHSWSLSLGLWVWTHYLTVSSVHIHSIAADGHTHSVLTITQPSKIAASIVFCSTTKLYRRKTDRIMQLLHHPRFTKTKTLSYFWNRARQGLSHWIHTMGETTTSVRAWAECWLGVCELRLLTLVTLFGYFQKGSSLTLSSFHVDSSLSQVHKQPTGPNELHRL